MANNMELLKKISFERIGGSINEYNAAMIINDEINKTNNKANIEEFEIKYSNIFNVELEVLSPYSKKIEATGIMLSGNTNLEGELVYVDSIQDAAFLNVEGKIALIHQRIGYKTYEKLIKAKAKGFICASGTVYDNLSETDLEEHALRDNHLKYGVIPGITIRMKDFEKLLINKAKTVKISLNQEEQTLKSRNVVATIKGEIENEIVVFTAHYDSVKFSQGAYDNGTGSVAIMDLYKYYLKHKPRRTLKFVWCGSEEMGLLGSKAYCKMHNDELNNYRLCINIDMLGVLIGNDICCCTTDNQLVTYIDYLAKEVGFPITVRQGVYSSDSTPFADSGIPSLSFARLSPQGGATIHSRRDVIKFIDKKTLDNSIDFIKLFANKLVNSKVFPVEKNIPQNMKDEIDKYYFRKEK